MEFGVIEILTGLGLLTTAVYYYLTRNFDFWKKQNVPGPKPIPFFGNFKDFVLGKTHVALLMMKYYNEFKSEPMIGIFGKKNPSLILKDPDLIKDVLIKDFNVFSDRGLYVNPKVDPLNQHLVNLEHDRWRPLRNKLSPVFTSGKLKEMFYLMVDCLEIFEKRLEKMTEKAVSVECRELSAKFTTQSIGVCAFGLDTKAIDDENSEFRKFGRALFASDFMNVCRRLLQEFAPKFYEMLGPYKYNRAMKFFVESMKQTMEYRRKSKIRRNDFVDLLMDLQSQPEKIGNIDFSDLFLIGQALVFFAAGFETSSTTISNTVYELALNQDVQNKLRQEIKEELKKNNDKLTYESIKNMKYLDKIVKETLRKYPPGSVLQRKSSEPYTFAGTKVTIPTDTAVVIPVWAIHRDPDIYPNPDVYDPERFSEENEQKRHPMNYLPFGDGPHICIGARFANYQTKLGIIGMINKFRVDVCDKTCIPYVVEPRSLVPAPIGGIYLKISKS